MAAATAWVRSLSCKYSTAVADDAYSPLLPPPQKKHPPPTPAKAGSAAALLPPERGREDRETQRSRSMSGDRERPSTARRKKKNNKDATSELARKDKPTSQQVPASLERPSSAFLELTELPEGHPSRRVVELIFASGWARAADDDQAPGEVQVEALFRVRSTARAVARFEAARAVARARGEAAADARCAADGNEVMRFQCRRAAEAGGGSEVICAAVATCHQFGAARAVRTFAGSGAADAGAGGEGCDGRKGMLVCRVIAGRVRRADTEHLAGEHPGSEYDSVDAGDGELVVLDRRAVLPCFLVVYNVNPPKLLESSSSRHSR